MADNEDIKNIQAICSVDWTMQAEVSKEVAYRDLPWLAAALVAIIAAKIVWADFSQAGFAMALSVVFVWATWRVLEVRRCRRFEEIKRNYKASAKQS